MVFWTLIKVHLPCLQAPPNFVPTPRLIIICTATRKCKLFVIASGEVITAWGWKLMHAGSMNLYPAWVMKLPCPTHLYSEIMIMLGLPSTPDISFSHSMFSLSFCFSPRAKLFHSNIVRIIVITVHITIENTCKFFWTSTFIRRAKWFTCSSILTNFCKT